MNRIDRRLTDIVLIHAYKRVSFLYPQIISFIRSQHKCECSLNNHNILFVIVDDSNDVEIEKKFRKEIKRINNYIYKEKLTGCWSIDYWSKKRQRELIKAIKGDEHSSFFQDAEVDKVGGVRTIQNISHIIADYLSGPKNTQDILVHKLDNDIFPYSLSFNGNGKYNILPIEGFFCKKRVFLKKLQARVVGSYYTLDSPSVITDLFEVIEAIHILFRQITKSNILKNVFDWGQVDSKLYVYGVPRELKCIKVNRQIKKLLNLSHLSPTSKLDNLLAQVAINLNLFELGVNRFEYNLENYAQSRNWNGEHGLISGGCLTFKIDEDLVASPNFADQDLLWTYLEHITKGKIRGDFSVLHVKTGLERRGFIDTVIRGKSADIRCGFPLTVKAQEIISKILKVKTRNEELLEFGGFEPGIVEKTQTRLEEIIITIDSLFLANFNKNSKLRASAREIKGHLLPIKNNYHIIKKRYQKIKIDSREEKKIEKQCRSWLNSQKQWRILRKRAKSTKIQI
jgi:hypothetical protein